MTKRSGHTQIHVLPQQFSTLGPSCTYALKQSTAMCPTLHIKSKVCQHRACCSSKDDTCTCVSPLCAGCTYDWANAYQCMHVLCVPSTQLADLCSLNGSPKQLIWLLHEVLIQRAIKGNVDGGGGLFPAPCSTSLLPERSYRACNASQLLVYDLDRYTLVRCNTTTCALLVSCLISFDTRQPAQLTHTLPLTS